MSKTTNGVSPLRRASGRSGKREDLQRLLKSDKDRIFVPFEDLRPTQVAVGMRAVAAKHAKVKPVAASKKRLETFLRDRPMPTVLGPGGGFFLVDRHHLGLALLQNNVAGAYVEVIEDLSHMVPADFWAAMEAEGRAYLFDESGERVHPRQIPRTLADLKADPYRDMAWALREAGFFRKVRVPFSEFRWAAFFRSRIPERTVRRNYRSALQMAAKLTSTRAASTLPGFLR